MLISGGSKFSYIIGNNGAGKSFALAEDALEQSRMNPVVVIASGLSDRFTYGRGTKGNGEGSYTYLGNRTVGNGIHINTLSSNCVLYYAKLLDSQRHHLFLNFLAEIGFDAQFYIEGLKKKRSADNYVGFDATAFDDVFFQQNRELFEDKSKSFNALFSNGGQLIPLGGLSSGQQTIISIALKMLSEATPGTIYYVDEPELSLHIEWQSKWPELFHELVSSVEDSKLWVATHSPIIIARALELGASCYSLQNGVLTRIEEDSLNVERIIFNEFHTYTPDNRHIYSEFSRILGSLVDKLNSNENIDNTKVFAETELKVISEKITKSVAVEKDEVFLKTSLADFSRAVHEVLQANAT